ncbi:uncharacterized protein EV422DRAFT_568618 [Fimicolochytrium jonesii]|uniref:uncharacterized protein n=1 Tax=Fimicolochytrium jonesii TaxID=1396493 RepID=UPI0022FF0339|nr:uncharacterized protein EV422DRAFT_568618 [Fimicolochytrium jonesii]KAI8819658.1 hypothetical protein EV422DRAFT_568618 [Fimicolochytrium jonesii]
MLAAHPAGLEPPSPQQPEVMSEVTKLDAIPASEKLAGVQPTKPAEAVQANQIAKSSPVKQTEDTRTGQDDKPLSPSAVVDVPRSVKESDGTQSPSHDTQAPANEAAPATDPAPSSSPPKEKRNNERQGGNVRGRGQRGRGRGGAGRGSNTATDANGDRRRKDPTGGSSEDATAATGNEAAGVTKPAAGPYRNPNRVLTGGADKKRLTKEELDLKMREMRRLNAELVAKKEAVAADEQAWHDAERVRTAQEQQEREQRLAQEAANRAAQRKKQEETMRIQAQLKRERAENAARKAQSMASREWDVGKTNDLAGRATDHTPSSSQWQAYDGYSRNNRDDQQQQQSSQQRPEFNGSRWGHDDRGPAQRYGSGGGRDAASSGVGRGRGGVRYTEKRNQPDQQQQSKGEPAKPEKVVTVEEKPAAAEEKKSEPTPDWGAKAAEGAKLGWGDE